MNPHAANANVSSRLYFLDWVRIFAFMLLIVYHTGMYYVTWGFHIKSAFASDAIEIAEEVFMGKGDAEILSRHWASDAHHNFAHGESAARAAFTALSTSVRRISRCVTKRTR